MVATRAGGRAGCWAVQKAVSTAARLVHWLADQRGTTRVARSAEMKD